MIRHKAPCINRQPLIINKVIKCMYYHLFVDSTNEDIDPVYRVESGKKTGLPAVNMVITVVHFLINS